MAEVKRAGAMFEHDLERELADPEARALFERELAKANAIATLLQTIEQARARRRLTKAEVARRVGSERSAISRLLAGKNAKQPAKNLALLAALRFALIGVTHKKSRTRNGAAW